MPNGSPSSDGAPDLNLYLRLIGGGPTGTSAPPSGTLTQGSGGISDPKSQFVAPTKPGVVPTTAPKAHPVQHAVNWFKSQGLDTSGLVRKSQLMFPGVTAGQNPGSVLPPDPLASRLSQSAKHFVETHRPFGAAANASSTRSPGFPTPNNSTALPSDAERLSQWGLRTSNPNYEGSPQAENDSATVFGTRAAPNSRRTSVIGDTEKTYRGLQTALGALGISAADLGAAGSISRSIPRADMARIDQGVGTWIGNMAGIGENPLDTVGNLATLGLGQAAGPLIERTVGKAYDGISKVFRKPPSSPSDLISHIAGIVRAHQTLDLHKLGLVGDEEAHQAAGVLGDHFRNLVSADAMPGDRRIDLGDGVPHPSHASAGGKRNILNFIDQEFNRSEHPTKAGLFPTEASYRLTKSFVSSIPDQYLADLTMEAHPELWTEKGGKPHPALGLYPHQYAIIQMSRALSDPAMARTDPYEVARIFAHELGHHLERFLNDSHVDLLHKQFASEYEAASKIPGELEKHQWTNFSEWFAHKFEQKMVNERFPRLASSASDHAFERLSKPISAVLEGWKNHLLKRAVTGDHADRIIEQMLQDGARGKPWPYLGTEVPSKALREVPFKEFEGAARNWRKENPGWDTREKLTRPLKPRPLEDRVDKTNPG